MSVPYFCTRASGSTPLFLDLDIFSMPPYVVFLGGFKLGGLLVAHDRANSIDKESCLANFTVALTYQWVNRLLASLIPWFRLILLINTVQNIHFFE